MALRREVVGLPRTGPLFCAFAEPRNLSPEVISKRDYNPYGGLQTSF